jgi:hypothetical protein
VDKGSEVEMDTREEPVDLSHCHVAAEVTHKKTSTKKTQKKKMVFPNTTSLMRFINISFEA